MSEAPTNTVRLGWSDGHSSGLYTWETLYRLAAECPS
jgi:DUF971 family protein